MAYKNPNYGDFVALKSHADDKHQFVQKVISTYGEKCFSIA